MTRARNGRRIALVAFATALVLPLSGCFTAFIPQDNADSTSKPSPTTKGTSLEEFYGQKVSWDDCEDDMECATIRAPMNWDKPEDGDIELSLIRQQATGGKAIGSLLVNPGGPGGSGYNFVKDSIDYAVSEDLQDNYDVVGFDPRGVGRSTPVKCYDAEEMDSYLYDLPKNERGTDEWIDEVAQASKEFGEACLENTGEVLEFINTVSAARDLDLMRELLGDKKLNYLGYSYGTFLGATFAELYPDKVGRLVLDGAIDPSASNFEVSKTQSAGFENALKAFLEDCIENNSDCAFSGTADKGLKTIADLLDSVDKSPLKGSDGRMVGSGTLLTAIIYPLYSADAWDYLNTMLVDVMHGDADSALSFADGYNGREDGEYLDNSSEAFTAYNCLDYTYDDDPAKMAEQADELKEAAPVMGKFMSYGDIGCANWPFTDGAERKEIHAEGAAPIMVVGTTNDPATPYVWAEALADQLESGFLVTYNGEGHTGYNKGSSCVDGTVDDFFLDGTVPDDDPDCD